MGKRGGWRMAAWLTLAFLAAGCSREDTDRLGRVGRLTAAKLDAATGGAQGKIVNGWQALRGSLGDTTPESRVFLRLHWDNMLAGLNFRVTATRPGFVRLEGTVASFDQRSRAVNLAHTTEGVQEVEDALKVAGH